jgi:hypothetical protein
MISGARRTPGELKVRWSCLPAGLSCEGRPCKSGGRHHRRLRGMVGRWLVLRDVERCSRLMDMGCASSFGPNCTNPTIPSSACATRGSRSRQSGTRAAGSSAASASAGRKPVNPACALRTCTKAMASASSGTDGRRWTRKLIPCFPKFEGRADCPATKAEQQLTRGDVRFIDLCTHFG